MKILKKIKNFWDDESGMGVVEVVLIIIVLVGLVMSIGSSLRQLPDRRHPALRMPERVTVHLRRKMAFRQKRRSHRMVRSAMI